MPEARAGGPALDNAARAAHFARMVRLAEEGARAFEERNLPEATEAFERAHQLVVEAQLGTNVAQGVLRNLAGALREAGEYRRATRTYGAALALVHLTIEQRGAILNDLGVTLGRAARLRPAMTCLRKAYRAWTAAGNAKEAARTLVNMAAFERRLGRPGRARRLSRLALRLVDDRCDVGRLAHLEAAAAAVGMGRPREALDHITPILRADPTHLGPAVRSEALRLRAAIHRSLGETERAWVDAAEALDHAVAGQEWEAAEEAFSELNYIRSIMDADPYDGLDAQRGRSFRERPRHVPDG